MWAESLDNAGMRDNLIRQAINNWAKSDPGAAAIAIERANITEATRTNLRQRIGNNQ